MITLLLSFLRGLGLGVAAGIPFGPVNVAVVDTSMRRCTRTALAVGAGGAFVDFLYSQLAALGIGRLLREYPDVSSMLIGGSGLMLVLFGWKTMLQPPFRGEPSRAPEVNGRKLASAFLAGVWLTLVNPAALLAWVVLAGALLSDLTHVQALVAGLGVFVGVMLWFAFIGTLARAGRLRFGERAVWLTRTIAAMVLVYGVFLVGKASAAAYVMHLKP